MHNFITVLLHESEHPQDSDVLQVDKDGQVVGFVSKHDDHTGAGTLGNAGLFIVEPAIHKFMQDDIFRFLPCCCYCYSYSR